MWLKENLNVFPKFGWHIDAFGHSNVMNYIFQQVGYEALFFARINDKERD
jgi:hypothetical protein